MLIKFKCSNFKNFEKEIIFDLTDIKNYEFNTNCIKNDFVKTGVIYGKNNSGKSNLGKGIINIISTLTDLPHQWDENSVNTFINADNPNEPAEFYFEFIIDTSNIIYKYKKKDVESLTYESLSKDHVELYHYDFINKRGDFTELLQFYPILSTLNFDNIESDKIAILKWILNNSQIPKNDTLHKLIEYIQGFAAIRINEKGTNYTGPLRTLHSFTPKTLIQEIINQNKVQEFTDYLSQMGIDTKLKVIQNEDNEPYLFFDYKKPIPFYNNASSGTKVLTILYGIMTLSPKITLLYLDELDANFHFEMAEQIVRELSNKDFQTFITSHNTDLMSNTILRPDCYFILSSEKITPLHRATSRELRMGHNLEKLYQSGEFTI